MVWCYDQIGLFGQFKEICRLGIIYYARECVERRQTSWSIGFGMVTRLVHSLCLPTLRSWRLHYRQYQQQEQRPHSTARMRARGQRLPARSVVPRVQHEDKHIKLHSRLAAAGMPHALGRRAGGSTGVQRGVQAARPGEKWDGDTRVKAVTADEREVRWMGECPRAASGGPAAWWLTNGVVDRGWRAVNVGYHCATANHGERLGWMGAHIRDMP
ncbi:hypothetical protein B0H14DRAFT_2651199 [Mycena olivaceomarginata]|nr:hypothetical protein B0H14DRAFT_2651199 [Mycena olivaceomarginata]